MGLFEKAVCFAVKAHGDTKRRNESVPYIVHPLETAVIAASMSDDVELLAAAVLHDTVEDTSVEMKDILDNFGPRVAMLVASETEDKMRQRPPEETWRARKEESLEVLDNADDIAVKMLWLGDKLSNMRSFLRVYRQTGPAMWQVFHQPDPEQQKWYYGAIRERLAELEGTDALREYDEIFSELFGGNG